MSLTSNKFIYRFIQLLILFFTLLFIEFCFYFISNDKSQFDFFYNVINENGDEENFDLLTGWTYTKEDIKTSNYKVKNSMVILDEYHKDCTDTVKFLITGGSTADVLLEPDSWPIHLLRILREKHSCITYRVAAVAGFNSSQELLKLIKLINVYKPDVHISYSGGNDYSNHGLITDHEKNMFHSLHGSSPLFMPYTVNFFTRLTNKDQAINTEQEYTEPYKLWCYNLNVMKALSTHYNYSFYGILSPVLGVGAHSNDLNLVLEKEEYKEHRKNIEHTVEMYQGFYKNAISIAEEHSFIHDFTNVFEFVEASPFIDDSHIEPKYQPSLFGK